MSFYRREIKNKKGARRARLDERSESRRESRKKQLRVPSMPRIHCVNTRHRRCLWHQLKNLSEVKT